MGPTLKEFFLLKIVLIFNFDSLTCVAFPNFLITLSHTNIITISNKFFPFRIGPQGRSNIGNRFKRL